MSGTALARDTLTARGRRQTRFGTRRLVLAGAALLAIAGGAWYGYGYWTVGRFIETTDDAYVGGDVTTIGPHVGGFVAEIAVTDNQPVARGQLLLRLDARDFRAAMDHAEATTAARQASLDNLHARTAQQQTAIRQAAAELAARRARAAFAAADAARYRTLAQVSAGSRQDAQRADAVAQEAQAAVQSAEAAQDAAQEQLGVLATETAEAAAALAQARADRDTALLNLGYTEIRAPIDGYIGNRAARVGEYVAPGSYLVSVIPARGLWVDANFKEDQLPGMVAGAPATVFADAVPGHAFHGHVESVAPGTGAVFSVIPAENATGNFTRIVQRVPVRIALDATDPALTALRPGLSMLVRVDTRTAAARR